MAEVLRVTHEYLPAIWPKVARMIERDGTLDCARVYRQALLGERTLWLAATLEPTRYLAVITTGLVATGPHTHALLVHLVAGRRIGDWIDRAVLHVGELVERTSSIRQVRIFARKGWMMYAVRFEALTELNVTVEFGRDRPTERGHRDNNRVSPEVGARHVA